MKVSLSTNTYNNRQMNSRNTNFGIKRAIIKRANDYVQTLANSLGRDANYEFIPHVKTVQSNATEALAETNVSECKNEILHTQTESQSNEIWSFIDCLGQNKKAKNTKLKNNYSVTKHRP